MSGLKKRFFHMLQRVFLSKEVRDIAEDFNRAGIKGVRVSKHGGFFVDAKYIKQSKEFKHIYRGKND